MSRRRPRSWRWLVVQRDLPPLPPHAEIVWGFLTKRAAEHEARMLQIEYASHNRYGRPVMVAVSVERSK